MTKKDEKYEGQKLNTRSLLDSFKRVGENTELEFAEEFEQQQKNDEVATAQEEQSTTDALLETYTQVIDSYREGTVDERSNNDRA